MESPTLDQMISFRVSRLQSKLNAQAVRILKERADLTPTQWRVLVMLENLRECTASEIARATQLDKGLLSRTIKSMTAGRLIEPRPGKAARRRVYLRLTEAGKCAYEMARPFMQERYDRLTSSLSDKERQVMYTAFEKLEAKIDESEASVGGLGNMQGEG